MDEKLILKVKKIHADAVIPSKVHENDSGWDLTAIDDGTISVEGYIQYRTGLSIQPPEGHDAMIYPRSSISKYDLVLANSIGLIDESYRGEVLVRFKRACRLRFANSLYINSDTVFYKKGDRIAQLIIRKRPEVIIQEVDELSNTLRKDGGFGSTGA